MALLLIISTVIFAGTHVDCVLNHPQWIQFKAAHAKSYSSENDELLRHSIFMKNLGEIEQHNNRYENGLETFTMKMNKFGDLTSEEVMAYRGLMNSFKEEVLPLRKQVSTSELPSSVDWREKGAVTAVKNQQDCGSCWAFAATGALEGLIFLTNGTLISLSEQNLVDCAKEEGNEGCEGGYPDWAFNYVRAHGIDTEKSYPYTAKDNSCKFKEHGAVLKGITPVMIPKNETSLKEAVANVGPVAIGIDSSATTFTFYSTGVFYDERCSSDKLDHGVLVVGYGTENGSDYWIVKNSWGPDWGDNGYILMARNRDNNCGVATRASYVQLPK